MTQSTLHRLQNDIEKTYNNLKKKNLFKQILEEVHGLNNIIKNNLIVLIMVV